MRRIHGQAGLAAARGEELGVSSWHNVTQARLDAFSAATGDHYWLHTDPVRAAATSIGSTIAHGLYTLSLGPVFTDEVVRFEGFDLTLNYGYERVRFPAPLPVGARLRMRARLTEVAESDGGARAVVLQTFERDGDARPVCVANLVLRFVAATPSLSEV